MNDGQILIFQPVVVCDFLRMLPTINLLMIYISFASMHVGKYLVYASSWLGNEAYLSKVSYFEIVSVYSRFIIKHWLLYIISSVVSIPCRLIAHAVKVYSL